MEEQKREFVIDDDKKADWAISQIVTAEAERDRLINLAQSKIDDLTAAIDGIKTRCENDTAYLKSLLYEYFRTVKPKETKTQASYQLLSGKLVFKKPSLKIEHDEDKLIAYLKENDGAEFIKVKESVDWAGFKKNLTISDSGEIIDTGIGVIMANDVCHAEEVPGKFEVKAKEEKDG